MLRTQQLCLTNAQLATPVTRHCEHSYSAVKEVMKWNSLMGDVLCRRQVSTAATGCCGFNAIKQSLGITDIRQVMVDIKQQILIEMGMNSHYVGDTEPGMRDLARVNTALNQVDRKGINYAGWFSDFLAEYVAKAYGVSILIIRKTGNFTFFQVLTTICLILELHIV